MFAEHNGKKMFEGWIRMVSRCDLCTQRFTWDCEDWRPQDDIVCDSFTLDWSVIPEDVQRLLQKILMGQLAAVPIEQLVKKD